MEMDNQDKWGIAGAILQKAGDGDNDCPSILCVLCSQV